jgi:MOSC domain-containing protein YiiM
MHIVSVNVARSAPLRGDSGTRTSIAKRPVDGALRVARLGIEGDEQADRRVHGGPFKAVYVYAAEHYPF